MPYRLLVHFDLVLIPVFGRLQASFFRQHPTYGIKRERLGDFFLKHYRQDVKLVIAANLHFIACVSFAFAACRNNGGVFDAPFGKAYGIGVLSDKVVQPASDRFFNDACFCQ